MACRGEPDCAIDVERRLDVLSGFGIIEMCDGVDARSGGDEFGFFVEVDRLPTEVVGVDVDEDFLGSVGVVGGVLEVAASVMHVRMHGEQEGVLLEGRAEADFPVRVARGDLEPGVAGAVDAERVPGHFMIDDGVFGIELEADAGTVPGAGAGTGLFVVVHGYVYGCTGAHEVSEAVGVLLWVFACGDGG